MNDQDEIAYRANERLGILMDDQGREPTRDEINMAWMQAMEQVRGMKSADLHTNSIAPLRAD